MNTVKRVAVNTGVQAVGRVINMVVGLFITIYLARYLGAVGYGKYSFVFAYLFFFMLIADFGVSTILVREISREKDGAGKMIGNAIAIKFILSLVAMLLSTAIITLLGYPADTTTAVYVASLALLFQPILTVAVMFQVNLRMVYHIAADVFGRILSLLLIVYSIHHGGGVIEVVAAVTFSGFVSMLLVINFSRRFVKPNFEIDFSLWKKILRESAPVALTTVFIMVYFRIDAVMLSFMVGDKAVGLYTAAYRLMEATGFIPLVLMVSMYPLMSEYFVSSREKLIKAYERSLKYLLIMALPIAVGTSMLADKIVMLIYGVEYAESVVALRILIWAVLFIFFGYLFEQLLISMNKQKTLAYVIGSGALLNVVLNLFLIPRLSYIGASITTLVTEGLVKLTAFYLISKYLHKLNLLSLCVKPLVSVSFMGCFVWYFREASIFLLIPAAAVVYFVMLFLTKGLSREDLDFIQRR